MHTIPVLSSSYRAVREETKTFEVVRAGRYRVGDWITIQELHEDGRPTGRELLARVTYVQRDRGFRVVGIALAKTGDEGTVTCYTCCAVHRAGSDGRRFQVLLYGSWREQWECSKCAKKPRRV